MFENSFSLPSLEWYDTLLTSPTSSINDLSVNTDDDDAGVTILSSQEAESSVPEQIFESEVSSPSLHTLSASPPSSLIHPSLSFVDWTTYWLMVSSISPFQANMELYRLGYVGRVEPGRPSSHLNAIRIKVFGKSKSGKTAFLNTLIGSHTKPCDTETTKTPQTRCTHIHIRRTRLGSVQVSSVKSTQKLIDDDVLVHIILTEVPESSVSSPACNSIHDCELAVLIFNSKDEESYKYIEKLESEQFTEDTPRVYIGTMSDTCMNTNSDPVLFNEEDGVSLEEDNFSGSDESWSALQQATAHCKHLDLEPPLLTSSLSGDVKSGKNNLEYLALCALDVLRSRPFKVRKRQEALRRKRIFWFGGLSVIGLFGGGVASRLLWSWSSIEGNKVGQWIRSCIRTVFGHGGGDNTGDKSASSGNRISLAKA